MRINLPADVISIVVDFIWDKTLLAQHAQGIWSDDNLEEFFKKYIFEIDEDDSQNYHHNKFKSLNNVNNVKYLHTRLKWLRFSDKFNQPIHLHEGLEEVIFGDGFNKPVNLPSTLIRATFGHTFNQMLDYIPQKSTLKFCKCYKHPVPKNQTTIHQQCPHTPERIQLALPIFYSTEGMMVLNVAVGNGCLFY